MARTLRHGEDLCPVCQGIGRDIRRIVGDMVPSCSRCGGRGVVSRFSR